MKIIVTGATGFVGGEVLNALLARPETDGVTCLSRRALGVEHAKLSTIIHDDFACYDDALSNELAEHDACIWTLGGKAADIVDPDAHRRITYDFTMALGNALAPRIRKRFAFCYLSGMGADQSETAWFPWEKRTRRLKGRTERDLIKLAEQKPAMKVHCLRPGGILPRGSSGLLHLALGSIVVGVDVLAESLVSVASDPYFDNIATVIGNGDIKWIAKSRQTAKSAKKR